MYKPDWKGICFCFIGSILSIILIALILHPGYSNNRLESIKQTVKINTPDNNIGTGVIVKKELLDNNKYSYYVLTAGHVVLGEGIMFGLLAGFEGSEFNINITIYDEHSEEIKQEKARIVDIDINNDVSILNFISDLKLKPALIYKGLNFDSIKVFKNVYSIGCQMGESPTITSGVISKIIKKNNRWYIMSDVKVSPGSSGGGLFIKINGEYQLIGLVIRTEAFNDIFIPHLGYFISTPSFLSFLINNNII